MDVMNLKGLKVGLLTVLRSIKESKSEQTIWECKCECGKTVEVCSHDLMHNEVSSCGCKPEPFKNLNRHLYQKWCDIWQRCTDPNHEDFWKLGERNVSVCEKWIDYNEFKDWALEHGYMDGCNVGRVDVNKDFSPDNCEVYRRWTE